MGQLILNYGSFSKNNTVPNTLKELYEYLKAHYSIEELRDILLDDSI